ncbi:MAG: PQQ-binding-like beta-propeller repeat protein [Thaumarchaeota archaeon]|nr:PQQ-binding-like beta-propeller repeat protein [Nitrososphaerota archaeon]
MDLRLAVLGLIVAATLLASSLVVALVPTASAFDPGGPPVGGAAPTVATGNWEFVNYQPTGGSYSPQNQINKDNVQYLETKWIYPYRDAVEKTTWTGVQRGSGAPVIIVDGTVYVLMSDRRILAIDAQNGRLLWNNTYGITWDAQAEVAKYPFLQGARVHGHAINYYRDKGWLITSSMGSCNLYAVDAKTGKTAWTLKTEQICGTTAEFGDPTKGIKGTLDITGYYSSIHTHPPQFLGNIMFFPVGSASGAGGRAFVTAFDMSNPANPIKLYRTWVFPPASGDPEWAIKQCNEANGNGWYFEYPRYLEGINHPARDRTPTYLATKCTDVAPDIVRNDWIDMVPGSPTFGKIHTASAISPVWGNYPIDQETGIVAMGWGDEGPYTNLTHRYGPAIHGSGFTAFDVRTGKLVWWFDAVTRDLWDYDCSWGGIIGSVQGQKALLKGCKNGIVYALDWNTGKPFWIYDAPTIIRGGKNIQTYYGVGANNRPTDPDACCRLTKADMGKPWMNYPQKGPIVQNCYTVCLESDFAYDGKMVYVGTFNNMGTHNFGRVAAFGNNGVGGGPRTAFPQQTEWIVDANVDAVDVNTGRKVWSYKVENAAFRGGVMVTGGMVVVYAADGNLKFLDATSGKLIHEKFFGIPVSVMPTVGASKDGKMKIFAHIGGGGGFLAANSAELAGNLVAFGLPDVIPQPQVREVIKEVPKEVIKEVIKEVPKEVIKEVPKEVIKEVIKEVPKEVVKEVVKEVPKEVVQTVTVETISPISYAAIGIGVVLVVVSGVLFSRRKKA